MTCHKKVFIKIFKSVSAEKLIYAHKNKTFCGPLIPPAKLKKNSLFFFLILKMKFFHSQNGMEKKNTQRGSGK